MGPVPHATREKIGPAGLEPASTQPQVAVNALVSNPHPPNNSTYAGTVAPDTGLAALIRRTLAAGTSLPRDLCVDLARLLDGG